MQREEHNARLFSTPLMLALGIPMETAMTARETQDVAFYYPGHLWYDVDQIKNMLLFLDGVGILIPEYKKGEPKHHDSVLAGSLREQGLLHYLVADEVVDTGATDQLVDAMERVISSGALEPLITEQTAFHELSMPRLDTMETESWRNVCFNSSRLVV